MWIHLVRRTPYAVIGPPSGDDDAPHPGRRSASIRSPPPLRATEAGPSGPGLARLVRLSDQPVTVAAGGLLPRSLIGSFRGGLETDGGAVDVSARLRCFLQPSERPPEPANGGMRSDSVPQAGHFNHFATYQVCEPSSAATARSWQGSEVPWNPTPARTAPATLRTRKWRSAPPSCGPQRPAPRPR